jgi:carbonic anhydrase
MKIRWCLNGARLWAMGAMLALTLTAGACKPKKSAVGKDVGAQAVAKVASKKPPTVPQPAGPGSLEAAARQLLNVLDGNERFTASHPAKHFDPFLNEQRPGATVVACSDSRFHDDAIDQEPDGNLFVIRNIGNQIGSVPGSVEYGIEQLHTPILLVVGHVGCGAVKGALNDYSNLGAPIRKELDGLHLSLREVQEKKFESFEERWMAGVVANVHRQVADALRDYEPQLKRGELFVVGSVYDFRGDFGMRRGSLHIVNLNGEQDVAKIYASPLLRRVAELGRNVDASSTPLRTASR